MQSYLFLATIGPVQEFIATARRSRDLWYGSYLLSELARAAAEVILAPPFSGRLIFPAPSGNDPAQLNAHAVANRILAELPGDQAPDSLGARVSTALHQRIVALRDTAFANIEWSAERPDLRDLALRQVEELIEVAWVSAPVTGTYATARELVENLMAAQKATRTFGPSPAPLSLQQPKSSLDGVRESVIPEELYPARGASRERRHQQAEQFYRRYRAGRAERLSGVDLLKRHGPALRGEADFPSTSHFAALPFLDREAAASPAFGAALERYLTGLRAAGGRPEVLDGRFRRPLTGDFDASILFEERLAEELDRADLDAARGHLAEFFAATTDGRRPEPYYALLHADGDNMGQAIDAQATAEQHRALSRVLDGFAERVRAIVEEQHGGALVYSGGDDVLAFLPLHTVLGCARALSDEFRAAMASYSGSDNRSPTLSVGVAVVHHIEPLADALNLAREAERLAKDLEGKDALAITISKRSGADRSIRGHWAGGAFLNRLQRFIDWHRRGVIPDGAAYELRDLHIRLASSPDASVAGQATEALANEAVRIFKRKRGLRGAAELEAGQIALLRSELGLQPEEKGGPAALTGPDRVSVAALADELIVAREFARALGEPVAAEGAR